MSLPGIIHALIGLLAVLLALVVFLRRKGDRVHKRLGWVFVPLMLASTGIAVWLGIARSFHAFNAYALITLFAVLGAVAASRFRARLPDWRFWHAGLMAFSVLSACVAMSGIAAGLFLDVYTGPIFYRAFNLTIVVVTVTGLLIMTPHLGRLVPPARASRALWTYHGSIALLTGAVILLQAY
jgi:uncharacterized membrane protein